MCNEIDPDCQLKMQVITGDGVHPTLLPSGNGVKSYMSRFVPLEVNFYVRS